MRSPGLSGSDDQLYDSEPVRLPAAAVKPIGEPVRYAVPGPAFVENRHHADVDEASKKQLLGRDVNSRPSSARIRRATPRPAANRLRLANRGVNDTDFPGTTPFTATASSGACSVGPPTVIRVVPVTGAALSADAVYVTVPLSPGSTPATPWSVNGAFDSPSPFCTSPYLHVNTGPSPVQFP
ncbi:MULTISPECIES: hypothetical protein [unclassified Streptomyces]|uniref:hypothetical protein n=1 Tax=unclassified Streptomyces TaxID=2593676 RepID=UPI0036E500B2